MRFMALQEYLCHCKSVPGPHIGHTQSTRGILQASCCLVVCPSGGTIWLGHLPDRSSRIRFWSHRQACTTWNAPGQHLSLVAKKLIVFASSKRMRNIHKCLKEKELLQYLSAHLSHSHRPSLLPAGTAPSMQYSICLWHEVWSWCTRR